MSSKYTNGPASVVVVRPHFSSHEPGELIGYTYSGVLPSYILPQFQTSPKPLARSKPNFMWTNLGFVRTIWAFLLEKRKTVDFSKTIAACDLKVGRCRKLIEFMKVCES